MFYSGVFSVILKLLEDGKVGADFGEQVLGYWAGMEFKHFPFVSW